jgi:hypothetical protein
VKSDEGSSTDDETAVRRALFGPVVSPVGDRPVMQTVAELDSRLPAGLDLMVSSPTRWILIAKTNLGRYVQFLATEEGVLVAECVSNEFLQGESRLSEESEELLPVLGWDWPAPPNQPNWRRVEFDKNAALDSAVLAVHTLRRVFGCRDDDVVYARLFRSSHQRSAEPEDSGHPEREEQPHAVKVAGDAT